MLEAIHLVGRNSPALTVSAFLKRVRTRGGGSIRRVRGSGNFSEPPRVVIKPLAGKKTKVFAVALRDLLRGSRKPLAPPSVLATKVRHR